MSYTLNLISPDEPVLFTGYRSPVDGIPEVYSSISHWFESEKFRGTNDVLREEARWLPTAREARKFARRHRSSWREDWAAVRVRVMRAGFIMAADQNPNVYENLHAFASLTSLEVASNFAARTPYYGYPLRWYAGVQWETAEMHIRRPVTLLLAGVKRSTYADKRAAIDKLVTTKPATQVLCAMSKELSFCAEEYAIANSLPIKYIPAPAGKMTDDYVDRLTEAASHIIVMERKQGREFDSLLSVTKKKKKPLRLILV